MPAAQRARRAVTDDWDQLQLRFAWPEQQLYELVRPVVLFGLTPQERAQQTGVSRRTVARHADQFDTHGIAAFLERELVKRTLPAEIRAAIVALKGEYPNFRPHEIAAICAVRFGRRPSDHTVARVLAEEPVPVPLTRRFASYHALPTASERRLAIIRLHAEGWRVSSIAAYLQTSRPTVYSTLQRWAAEAFAGLPNKPRTRKRRALKTDLRAVQTVRALQQNPELGEFRIHAALQQLGIELSPRTCGRLLAENRRLYGLAGPARAPQTPQPMPFAAQRRHEIWSVDVRYLDHQLGDGKVYCITILENYSRAVLASALSRTQDLRAFLLVFYAAVRQHGAPEKLVSDSGSIFLAKQARAIYTALGITKEQIARRQPWQNYIETTFNIQRRMADWHFAHATSGAELQRAHDRWVADYNYQEHWAHRDRQDGRRSPAEVLDWVCGTPHPPALLGRLFRLARAGRRVDRAGYVRFRHWRIYGERGLAQRQAAVWLYDETLTVAFGEEPLAHYAVDMGDDPRQLQQVSARELVATPYGSPQPPLWPWTSEEWLLVLRMRQPVRRPRPVAAGVQGAFTLLEPSA